jgi:S1-C subfamily serine protease
VEAPRSTGGGRRRLLGRVVGAVALAGIAGGAAGSAATVFGLRRLVGPDGTTGVAPFGALSSGPANPASPVSLAPRPQSSIAALYKQVAPSVVAVRTNGEGSGFVVDAQGHVITNNHVVQGTTRATLHLLDGTSVPAEVVATDPANDLAVLKANIPAGKLVVTPLGDSDTVTTGEAVIAIGSPFGFEHSVTSGIVSAVDRQFGGGRGRSPIQGLIQTDTSINPGNSGGPLFNAAGEAIGVNTMGVSTVGGSVGVGFAVPINAVKRLLTKVTS